jgi:hypothetical protein
MDLFVSHAMLHARPASGQPKHDALPAQTTFICWDHPASLLAHKVTTPTLPSAEPVLMSALNANLEVSPTVSNAVTGTFST